MKAKTGNKRRIRARPARLRIGTGPFRRVCAYLTAAPAAYDTIHGFFADTNTKPEDYDLIVTGDLAKYGKLILADMFREEGVELGDRYNDCGLMIFDNDRQDTHAGGSGCGCSASVLCGHILNGMHAGTWRKVLFAATGALMSPMSTQQGESIPSICHLIAIES